MYFSPVAKNGIDIRATNSFLLPSLISLYFEMIGIVYPLAVLPSLTMGILGVILLVVLVVMNTIYRMNMVE